MAEGDTRLLEAGYLDIQALESAAALESGEAEADKGVAGVRYSKDGNLSEIRNEDGSVWRLNENGSWIKHHQPGYSINGIKQGSRSARKNAGMIELPGWLLKLKTQ